MNNAGITRDTLLMRMSEEDWDKVISVNLKGVYNCTKAAISLYLKLVPAIVNVASVVGITGNIVAITLLQKQVSGLPNPWQGTGRQRYYCQCCCTWVYKNKDDRKPA